MPSVTPFWLSAGSPIRLKILPKVKVAAFAATGAEIVVTAATVVASAAVPIVPRVELRENFVIKAFKQKLRTCFYLLNVLCAIH
jgi:hypothetical protein